MYSVKHRNTRTHRNIPRIPVEQNTGKPERMFCLFFCILVLHCTGILGLFLDVPVFLVIVPGFSTCPGILAKP